MEGATLRPEACIQPEMQHATKCSIKSLTTKGGHFLYVATVLGNLITKNVAVPQNVVDTDPTQNVASSAENVAAVDLKVGLYF